MFGRPLKRQRTGQPIEARTLNRPIEAVEGLSKLRVGAGLGMRWLNGIPFIWALAQYFIRVYYTTSIITSSTASATGTALGSASVAVGSGTARNCIQTGTGTSTAFMPDPNASDDTVYNWVVTSPNVASGSFIICVYFVGQWYVLMTIRCPGT